MKKDPAMLFYPANFIISTSGLSFKERGVYITLLCLQHQNGHLSKKTINTVVRNISKSVLDLFELDEQGLYYNKELEEEINRRRRYCQSRSENGKKKYEKKEKTEKGSFPKNAYGEFKNVFLTNEEYEKLREKYPRRYEKLIDELSIYIESKGDKYKSHYAVILSWERKNGEEKRTDNEYSSFDTDEFFHEALKRSAIEIEKRSKPCF